MTVTSHQAFIDQIREAPHDDDARLIYADWLEERGDPRGDFIRLQIQAEQSEEFSAERFDLDQAARKLHVAHHESWEADLRKSVKSSHSPCDVLSNRDHHPFDRYHYRFLDYERYEKGLLNTVIQTPGQFVAADKIGAFRSILVSRAELGLVRNGGDKLATCPSLSCLTDLTLHIYERGLDIRSFFQKSNLVNLRKLSFCFQTMEHEHIDLQAIRILDDDDAIALSRMEQFQSLESLDISFHHIGPKGIKAIAHSPYFQKLRHLNIEDNDPGDPTFEVISQSPIVQRMTHLSVKNDAQCRSMTARRPAQVSHLKVGEFHECDISETSFTDLLAGFPPEQLKEIRLGWKAPFAIKQRLFQSPNLANLRSLSLIHASFTDALAKSLAESQHLGELRHFYADCCNRLNDEGFATMIQSNVMRKVWKLRLRDGSFGNSVFKAIANSIHLGELRSLLILDIGLTDVGLESIEGLQAAPKLKKLVLSGNTIGDRGAELLCRASNLDQLTLLVIYNCEISQRGEKQLRERFGDVLWYYESHFTRWDANEKLK